MSTLDLPDSILDLYQDDEKNEITINESTLKRVIISCLRQSAKDEFNFNSKSAQEEFVNNVMQQIGELTVDGKNNKE